MRGAAVVIAGLLGCATLTSQGPAPRKDPTAPAATARASSTASEARIRALAPTPTPVTPAAAARASSISSEARIRALAPAAAPPAKKEIEVIGRGPVQMGGIKPQEEGTEFVVVHGTTFRCTKVPKSGTNREGLVNCRNLSRGDSRNPDIGRQHRSQTQGVQQ